MSPKAQTSRELLLSTVKLNEFFVTYKELLENHTYTAGKGWNMDKPGITNVHAPGNVIATKGIRQVGMTSGKRGATVTVICAMNASGGFLSPMLIFPRKRMQDRLMLRAPSQSVGYCSANGWTDSDMFVKWLEHFVANTNASKATPQATLDAHHSHKSLAAVTYAIEHGIQLSTLPPHCTHKMQPSIIRFSNH